MKQQLKSFLIMATAATAFATMVGCSTGVKLDTPVEDRAGAGSSLSAGMGGTGAGANTGQSANSGVATVDLANTGVGAGGGPANVGKIIYFDFDSYLVKPEYASVVNAHVQFLTSRKTSKITVEGHTDSSGGREYNLALGQKRALAVLNSLTLLGVAPNQVEAVSYGKERPLEVCSEEACYAKNRRAVTVLSAGAGV